MSPEPPPVPRHGAFDLDALKHRNGGASKSAQAAQVAQQLINQNLLCMCGERITDHGVRVYGTAMAYLPMQTPMGWTPPQDMGILAQAVFCSTECEKYKEARQEGISIELPGPSQSVPLRAEVIAERAEPELRWVEREEES